jgi:hypothetical protein
MRPQCLRWTIGFFLFSFLFLCPSSSFASSRQQIIDNALTKVESSYPSENTPSQNPYSAKIPYPDVPPQETIMGPSGPTKSSNVSDEKKQAIDKALNLYVSVGYDLNHIHYSEWQNQDKLDEDFGTHHGFYLNLGYKSQNYNDMLRGKPFLEGYFRKDRNLIKYKGATFDAFGDSSPYNTKQRSVITRYGAKLGSSMDFLKDGEFFGYVDVGRRVWDRGENGIEDGVTVYKEKYEWIYYGLGVGINYKFFQKLSVGLDWTGWLTSTPKMRSYLAEGATFRLRQVWGMEIKLPIKYYLLKNLTFDFTPYYTFWRINHSGVVDVLGMPLYEPDSNTREEGFLTGLTYAF